MPKARQRGPEARQCTVLYSLHTKKREKSVVSVNQLTETRFLNAVGPPNTVKVPEHYVFDMKMYSSQPIRAHLVRKAKL